MIFHQSVLFYPSEDHESLASLLDNFKPSDSEVIERTKVSQSLYNNHYTSLQLMERLSDI